MNTTPVAAIIEKDGAPEYAVLPWAEYQALLAAVAGADEDAADRAALALVDADPDEEYLPEEMANRLLDGENPLRVWRVHRGLSIREVAAATPFSESYISQIETGKRAGSVKAMRAFAAALDTSIDDITYSETPNPVRKAAKRRKPAKRRRA